MATVWLAFAAATAFALTPPSTGTLAAGSSHTAVVKSDGAVWAWGLNDYGQLGDGTKINRSTPVPVSSLSGVVAVAAGTSHTVALKSDGTVWAWGRNNFGQLGNGATSDSVTPVQVNGLSGVVAIAAGNMHTVAVRSDGTVWTWGNNSYGQLGDGTTISHTVAVQVSGLTDVVAVAAGYDHTVALKRDGTVWAWGYNTYGQVGDGTTTRRTTAVPVTGLTGVLTIAAGNSTTLSLKTDGSVWAWGANSTGQLGDGTTTTRTAPVAVSGLGGVVALSAGQSFVLALKADGSVWAWGANSAGQIGDGTTTNRTTPVAAIVPSGVVTVAAGSGHGVVLTNDGAVWSWGSNSYGQMGDGTAVGRTMPVQVTPLTDVLSVEAGDDHTVAVKSDGTLWTWGYNAAGELGDGTTISRATPKPVVGLNGIVAAAADINHTVAVRNDGTVWAWGRNTEGELGDGTTISRTTPMPVSGLSGVIAVAAGYMHTVALKSDGTVWSWGYNSSGQLGDGTTTRRTTPVQVTGLVGIIAVAAGDDFTFAVKNDGTLWAWGSNYYGQLGDGTLASRPTPVQVSALNSVVAVAAGEAHSVALKSDGTVWTWGYNNYGQLGDGTAFTGGSLIPANALSGAVAVAAGDYHTVALKSDGTVWAWGCNNYGQLGDGTTTQRNRAVQTSGLSDAVAISAGCYFTIALKSDRTIRGWGNNSYGQLGFSSGRLTQAAIRLIPWADDTDQDGMSDAWERQYFGNLTHRGGTDTDGDGLTDIQEFVQGSDPTQADIDGDGLTDIVDPYPNDFYDAVTPSLTAVSGDNQVAAANAFNAQPLDVAVWNAAATSPLVGAPVTFAVTSGDGSLAATLDGSPAPSLALRTDQDGTVQVYFKHGSASGSTSEITVSAGNALLLTHSTTSKLDQTIAFTDPGPQSFGVPLSLSATASSGLPVRFEATSGPVAIANGLATFTGAGSVTITAKQDGNGTYNAAPNVARTFIVNLGSQSTVTLSPSTASIGVGDTVTFTASGGVNSYVWGGRASGTGSVQTVAFNSVGTFAVTVYAQADGRYAQSNTASAIVTAIDTVPPVIAVPDNLVVEATGADGAVVTFAPSATDLVDGAVAVSASPSSGSAFPLGTTTVALSATDAAGNTATSAFTVTVRDTTAPTIALPANQTLEATGPDGAMATFSASANDLVSGSVEVTYSSPSGSSFALGTNTIAVIATDAAGNTATGTFTVTVRDTTAPVLTLPETITAEATAATGATVTLVGSATDLVSGDVPIAFSPASNTVFPMGETTVTATATDAAGNASTATLVVTVVDTIAPVLTLPDDITVEATGPAGATVMFAATAVDTVSGNLDVSYSAAPGSVFALGKTTVTVTAVDVAGNVVTGNFNITVVDTTGPIIAVPANQTLEATSAAGAVANFSASATDLVDGAIAVRSSRASGSTFAVGVNTVTLTATDAAGNASTRTFTVTVRDTTAPTLTVPANIALGATDQNGAVVTYSASATDLVDGSVVVVASMPSGSVFPIGATKVTLTAKDAAGNTATGFFTVTVAKIPPVITNPPLSQVVAVGSSVTFSVEAVGTKPFTYKWKFGSTTIAGATGSSYTIPSVQASNAGSYSVVVSNAAGSVTSSAATLSVKIAPAIATQPVNATVTAGKNATFKVVASGSATLTYQWCFNGSTIPGAGAATYTVTAAQSTNVGTYSVIVANAVGSVTSVGATLKVNYPVVITSQPVNQSITLGSVVTFGVEVTGTAPFAYQWRRNGGAIAGATSSNYTIPAAQTADAGSYTVVVTNVAGCITSSTAVLKVNVPPAITTQPVGKSVAPGTTVTFKVVATGTATLTYQWKLNNVPIDGATAASYTVVAKTATVGTYTVVVSNVAGSLTSSAAILSLK